MIVGFMNKNRVCAGYPVVKNGLCDATTHRWDAANVGKTVDSEAAALYPLLGRHGIIDTKRLQQDADEAEWEKPVCGLKRGSSL